MKYKLFNINIFLLQFLLIYNLSFSQDQTGPNKPNSITMSKSSDTKGKSDSDKITYQGNPKFEWTKPTDIGNCGTNDKFQYAVTNSSETFPDDLKRLLQSIVSSSSTSIQPGNLEDGNYKFWVQYVDNCENWGQWDFIIYTIDTKKPEAPSKLNNPENPTDDLTPNVYWLGDTDNLSGIWTYDIEFTDSNANKYTFQSSDRTLDNVDFGNKFLFNGIWSWKVRVIDIAGNVSDWSTTKSLTIQDQTGPNKPNSITMSKSFDTKGKSDSDQITYQSNPKFEWTKPIDIGNCGTNDKFQYAVTNSSETFPDDLKRLLQSIISSSSTSIQPGNLKDGNYKFWIQYVDKCNNWGQWDYINYTIDTLSPIAPDNLNNPENTTIDVTPNVYWSGDTDSLSGIWTYDVEFTDSDANKYTFQSGDRTLDDVDFGNKVLTEGIWSWKVRAVDIAGNVSNWSKLKYISIENKVTHFPFPQNNSYSFGIMPEGKNSDHLIESYFNWKKLYVTSEGASGYRRVLWDDLVKTRSEGIGYGMLISVNMNDKPLFNDLWNYYKNHLDKNGLMNWEIDGVGNTVGFNSATDADQDVAFALILAYQQWEEFEVGVTYLSEAKKLIQIIFKEEVEKDSFVLKPGDCFGGSDITNPSYFSPAYYRIFHKIDNTNNWQGVTDTCYSILKRASNRNTGLVPDWCQANGLLPIGVDATSRKSYYSDDASRTPLRIALDYLWNGNNEANTFCKKITSFAQVVSVKQIKDGYNLNGTPRNNGNHNNIFIGTFGVGAMASSNVNQSFCDSLYDENVIISPLSRESNYYNWSLKTISLLIQTGNFLNPNKSSLPLQIKKNDVKQTDFLLNQNYPNPFNPVTKIEFKLSKMSYVDIIVYDLLGKELKTLISEQKYAGDYEVSFDGSHFASGIYMYTLKTENFKKTRKMVLLK